jgi:hypothetical protein
MKQLCGLLVEELVRWPDVRMRPMFGLQAFYRRDAVFAMLPGKRAIETPRTIAYKLAGGARSREGKKWQHFELQGAQDISKALAHLEEAYKKALANRK